MQYLSCVYIQDREQNIEHQTSFQNTWYWIMASMQVAQTRWRLYTRKHITSFSKCLSILGYNLGFAFLWFEGCWGTMWGEGTISFIFMQVSLLYMYLMTSCTQLIFLLNDVHLLGAFSSDFSPLISGACRICRLQFSWWKSRYSVRREG